MTIELLVEKLGELGRVWPDAVSVRAVLGRPATAKERATWRTLIRTAYGADALLAGYAMFGRDLELRHLSALQPHAGEWLQRAQQAPALAPAWRPHVLCTGVPPQDSGAVRASVIERGLTRSGWRWLCQQRPETTRRLLVFGWTAEAIFWINLLSRALPGRQMASGWLEQGRPYMFDQHYERIAYSQSAAAAVETMNLERFFRLLPPAATPEGIQQLEVLASGLLAGMSGSTWPLRAQTNSTWKGLLERLRRYNDERQKLAQAEREARAEAADAHETEQPESISWAPVFGTFETGAVQARELLSTEDLLDEGTVLDHCVGDGAYLQGCLTRDHLIVSLKERYSGMRATLQLRRCQDQYITAQLSGLANSRVPQIFWSASRKLQAHLSRAA